MSNQHYDFFVIGAGSGGVRAARIAASHGAKVGIAESASLGGTCVNLGCVPKKLLSYAADYSHHFRDANGYGWNVQQTPSFSWEALIENKNIEINRLNGIYKKLLEACGAALYEGHASFIDERTVKVDNRTITADKILIATGGKPYIPEIPGKEHLLSSDQMFYLPKQPKHIVIIGAGYIGVEFAHIFRGLGSKVTLIHRGEQIMRGFDWDIRNALYEEMIKQDIDIKLECDPEKAEKNNTSLVVYTKDGNAIECDIILSATGRIPNTDGLNLKAANVQLTDKGQIITDELYHTTAANIYAVGDITNQHNLTPVAIQEGHALADRLFTKNKERQVNYNNIATAVFSSPPIGTVGMSEEQAIDRGYDVKIFKTDFRPLIHTLSGRNERTYMKLVVDRASDKVLGIHVLGMDAPEIIQGFALALNCGATKADFDRTMAIHPTAAEELVTMRFEEKQ